MKTILLWHPRFPDRRPARLTVEDTVASAAVRAGVAAAANPAEAGALSAGAALDPGMLTEVALQHGSGSAIRRIVIPYSVALVGAAAGVLAAVGTPIAGGVVLPTLTLTGPLNYSTTSPSGTLVANIGNVPAGVTPTLTPNDGRLVIAGSAGAWTVVTGLSASTAGTITLAVAAAGTTAANVPVTVVAGAIYRFVGNKASMSGGYGGFAPFGAVASAPAGITYRTQHYVGPSGGFSKLKVLYAGVYNLTPGGENPNPQPFTKKISVEIGGVLTPVAFAGSSAGMLLSPSALLVSDVLDVTVAGSTSFQVRDYSSLVSGQRFTSSGWRSNNSGPDGSNVAEFPLSAGADLTATGTSASFTNKNNKPWMRPLALIGIPANPATHIAVLIIGDSIGAGSEGGTRIPVVTAENYFGFIEPVLADNVAWQTCASGGTRYSDFLVGHTFRDELIKYATSVICELGCNDTYEVGMTVAVLQQRAISTWQSLGASGAKVFQTTITLRTSSADGWLTTTNQSRDTNVSRLGFNNWLRDGAPMSAGVAVAVGTAGALRIGQVGHPLLDYFEVANMIEANASNVLTQDGGYWYCGAANNTASTVDGTHPIATGYLLMRAAIVLSKLR